MSKKLLSNSIYYTLGKTLPMAVSFFMVPIYTKFLEPSDYGIINAMMTIRAVLTILFSFSVENSLFRLYYDYKDEEKKRIFLGTVFITILFISITLLCIIFCLYKFVEKIYSSTPFYPYYFLIILTTFFGIFSVVPRITFVIREKGLTYFLVGVVQLVVGVALSVLFIIVLMQKALGVLRAGIICSILFVPLYLFFQLRYSTLAFNFDMAKKALKYSLPLMPAALASWILTSSDRIFIDRYFTMSDVGIYGLGYKISYVYIAVITSVRLAYNPIFFRLANSNDQIDAQKKLYKYNYYYFLFSLSFSFLLIFFCREVIGLLINYRYYKSWIICSMITYAVIFTESGSVFRMSIYQHKKTYIATVVVVTVGILNLLLNYLFVPKWSMYGAAMSTIICSMLMFFLFFVFSIRCYYIKVRWFILSILFFSGIGINVLFWLLPLTLLECLILKILFLLIIVAYIVFYFREGIGIVISKLRGSN